VTPGPRVVHVIECLSLGGPLFALAGAVRESRGRSRHALVSLLPPDARAVAHARASGIEVLPTAEALLDQADIVQVHFWNNPAIHAFLRSALPSARVFVWCHVNGLRAPQVLPAMLFERADLVAATSELSLDTAAFRAADPAKVRVLFADADLSRVGDRAPHAREGCTIGYVGRVDFMKLHPGLVRMFAAVRAPGLRFLAAGGGNAHAELSRQAQTAGLAGSFGTMGQVEDIGALLAQLDVFAYPLRAETTATSELMLQEAMAAGLPCVVFAHAGLGRRVEHGRNGLVVATEEEFTRALEHLAENPRERARLGAAAAADARARFGSARLADGLHEAYDALLRASPKARAALPPLRGAQAFLESLDGQGDADLRGSLSDGEGATAAEARIACADPNLRDAILQYRIYYPDDPWLRLWAGLLLRGEGRRAPAALEFKTCLDHGLDRPRVRGYFEEAMQA